MENAGYQIIQIATIGNTTVALGQRDTGQGAIYVTWECDKPEPTSYFWGHYTSSKTAAQRDWLHRLTRGLVPTKDKLYRPIRVLAELYVESCDIEREGDVLDRVEKELDMLDPDTICRGKVRIVGESEVYDDEGTPLFET